MQQTNYPGRWSGPNSSSLPPRERRAVRGVGAAPGGDLSNQHLFLHQPPLHSRPAAPHHQGSLAQPTAGGHAVSLAPGSCSPSSATSAPSAQARSEVSQSGVGPNQCVGTTLVAARHTSAPLLSSQQPEGVSSSSESLTPGGAGGVSMCFGVRRAGGGADHHPPSQIPRAVGASASSSLHSLASRGSPSLSVSSSDQASPPPPTPSSASSSSSASSFTGRLGQPPRGPLSLHSYSRKNVFLQHSLHTAELQALTQRDSWGQTNI